jgi:DNA-3-methyladenine glycosylase
VGDNSRLTVERERLARPSYLVAPQLLGAVLVSEVGGATVAVRLTEVEAYHGLDDPASHAYRGETRRNAVMFGPAGYLYTYFTYGMHWCANIVCGVEGQPTAVLLRAGEVVEGIDVARERRARGGRPMPDRDLARGPARLASCLALTGADNADDLCSDASPVRLMAWPSRSRRRTAVASGPRVGISVAIERPWRFWLEGDPTVSVYRRGGRKRVAPTGQTDVS